MWTPHDTALRCAALPCRLEDAVVGVAGSVRENIRLRRGFLVAVPEGGRGLVGSYLHTAAAPGLGRIAGLVALQSEKELGAEAAAAVQELAGKLAMQVVGAKPQYLSREHVPDEALAAERALLTEQALKSGAPYDALPWPTFTAALQQVS